MGWCIKPGFFANDDLAECEPLARLLFIGLWTIADSRGVLEHKLRNELVSVRKQRESYTGRQS